MSEHETEHDPAGDELREQEGKGYGEDEGERDPGLEHDDDARAPDEPGADSR
jgi:hypothetical protein